MILEIFERLLKLSKHSGEDLSFIKSLSIPKVKFFIIESLTRNILMPVNLYPIQVN